MNLTSIIIASEESWKKVLDVMTESWFEDPLKAPGDSEEGGGQY